MRRNPERIQLNEDDDLYDKNRKINIYLRETFKANGDEFESHIRDLNRKDCIYVILNHEFWDKKKWFPPLITLDTSKIKSCEEAYEIVKKKSDNAIKLCKFKTEQPELYEKRREQQNSKAKKRAEKKAEKKELEMISKGYIPSRVSFAERAKLINDMIESRLPSLLPANEIISTSYNDENIKVYLQRGDKPTRIISIDVSFDGTYDDVLDEIIYNYNNFIKREEDNRRIEEEKRRKIEEENRRREEENNKPVNIFKQHREIIKKEVESDTKQKPMTAFAKMQAELTRAERAKYIAQAEKEKAKSKSGGGSDNYLNKTYSIKKKNPGVKKMRRNPANGTVITSTYKMYMNDGSTRESTKYIVPSKTKYGFTLSNEPYAYSSIIDIKKRIQKYLVKYYEDRHGINKKSDIIVNFKTK